MEPTSQQQSKPEINAPSLLEGEADERAHELNQGELAEHLQRIDRELSTAGSQSRPVDKAGEVIERRAAPRPDPIRIPTAPVVEPEEVPPHRRAANSLIEIARRALRGGRDYEQPNL